MSGTTITETCKQICLTGLVKSNEYTHVYPGMEASKEMYMQG